MDNKQIHDYNNCGNYIVPIEVKNGVCIDIGGNTGAFSLKYVEFFKTIHIYEPQLECYKIIKERLKNYNNIEIFNEAVYNESGKEIELISHGNNDSGSVALNSDIIQVKEWKENIVVNKAKTISFEDILKRSGGYIDYMKCDCETSEYNLLMNKDLSNIGILAIELHWQLGKDNFNKLIDYILKYFNIYKINTYDTLDYPIGTNIERLFINKKFYV